MAVSQRRSHCVTTLNSTKEQPCSACIALKFEVICDGAQAGDLRRVLRSCRVVLNKAVALRIARPFAVGHEFEFKGLTKSYAVELNFLLTQFRSLSRRKNNISWRPLWRYPSSAVEGEVCRATDQT